MKRLVLAALLLSVSLAAHAVVGIFAGVASPANQLIDQNVNTLIDQNGNTLVD